jgi:serine/threonine protein kinase
MSEITPHDFVSLRILVPWELDDGDMYILPLAPKEREAALKKARNLREPVLNNTSKYLPNGVPKILIAHDKNGGEVTFLWKKKIGSGSFGDVYLYEEAKEKDGRLVIIAKPRQFALKVIEDADECKDTSFYLNTKGEIGKTCELISQKCLNPPGFGALTEDSWNEMYKKVGKIPKRYDDETDDYVEYGKPITLQEVQEKVYPSAKGPFLIVMDKEDGDLADLLREYSRNPEKLKLIVQDVWTALNCLITDHKKGYMDLKAANVLYSMKEGKVVIKIGDLGGICDFKNSGVDTATFPPSDMWVKGFVGTDGSPCTEATMTWLMAVLACRIFGVITRDDESAIYWNGIQDASSSQRQLDEILARLTMKVKWAIKDNKFGSLPTINLIQCFSAKPMCRPPFKEMFSKTKWNSPADCMSVKKRVVPPTAPKVNAVPSGATSIPVRELQAQIKKAEEKVKQLRGNRDRAIDKRVESKPQELIYWKRQEEAAEGKLKRSKNELKSLQEKLPAYIKPHVLTPSPPAVLPPSPPMVPRLSKQNVDIKENVILGLMGGGRRKKKNRTRRKSTQRRRRSKKCR